METNDLVERLPVAAAAIVAVWMGGNQEWRTRLDDSDFLESADWANAQELAKAALEAAGVSTLQARVAVLEGALERVKTIVAACSPSEAMAAIGNTIDAALSPDHQEGEKSDYCGHVEVNPDDFDISKLSPPLSAPQTKDK